MRKLLIAISFFTRIPFKVDDVSDDEFYESMLLMPIVGLMIGSFLFIFAEFIHMFRTPIGIKAILILMFYVWLSGGLHIDGFCDTLDGIFSSRNREKMMQIMKDSRLGAFGAMGLILLFMTIWTCLASGMEPVFLVVAPVVGRYCALQSCHLLPYAQGGGGLGKRITEITEMKHVLIYLIALMTLAGSLQFYFKINILLPTTISIIIGLLSAWYIKTKIGGMTGDVIGFTIELMQAVFLLLAASF